MQVHGSPHLWWQSKGSGAGWGSGADRQQVWCGGSSQHVTLGAACRNVQLQAILSHSLAWPAHLGPQAWPVPTKVEAVDPGDACYGKRGAGGGLRAAAVWHLQSTDCTRHPPPQIQLSGRNVRSHPCSSRAAQGRCPPGGLTGRAPCQQHPPQTCPCRALRHRDETSPGAQR